MVYKIQATNKQEAGDYQANIVYIITPTF